MFWGVTLETGKRYSQRVEESYHLTMAALEPPTDQKKSSKYVSVMVEHDKSDYMVCTLEPNRNLQVHLDLMFVEGEEVTYYLTGDGTVHLTGYLVGDPYDEFDEEDDEELEDEESEDEVVAVNGQPPKSKANKRKNEALESSPEAVGKKVKVDSKVPNKESKPIEMNNKTSQQKNKNEKKVSKVNAINIKESEEEDDSEEDDDSDESAADKSLGLIDSEAVEVGDDSDDDDEDEEESDEDSDGSEEPKSSPVKNQNQQKGGQNQKQQNNQKPQQNQNNFQKSPQNQNKSFEGGQRGGFGGQQRGGFGGQQRGGFGGQKRGGYQGGQQKGQWNQSGQKSQRGGGGGNQWQNRGQGGNQGNTPNKFGGEGGKQTPNFKGGPNKGNFNKSPNFSGQKGSQGKQNRKPWNSDKKELNKNEKQTKLSGGIVVQDLVEGDGPNANKGKFVHVSYVGRLPDKRVFDKTHNKPFSFKLGKGEVIKGWDIGLQGMKVGGKRKIIIPPKMGYGNRSVGSIPANSTLEFEVELKSVT